MIKRIYSYREIDSILGLLVDNDYDCVQVDEGTLGSGNWICTRPGYKSVVIKEIGLNEWSSGHTITRFNVLPKKYQAMLKAVLNAQYDDLICCPME